MINSVTQLNSRVTSSACCTTTLKNNDNIALEFITFAWYAHKTSTQLSSPFCSFSNRSSIANPTMSCLLLSSKVVSFDSSRFSRTSKFLLARSLICSIFLLTSFWKNRTEILFWRWIVCHYPFWVVSQRFGGEIYCHNSATCYKKSRVDILHDPIKVTINKKH